jgi:transposase-like protein
MNSLNAPHFHDDDKAREYLESVRWPNGPVCPHCGSTGDHYRLEGKGGEKGKKARKGLLKCQDCREQFSVTVGTVFERSKIPLSKWLMAAYLMCSSKKGISAHQLHRTLGVTYKTAWFLAHRIRFAMADFGKSGPMGSGGGTVEVDETYLGKTEGLGKGPFLSKKQKVVSLVERGGNVRSFHVERVTINNIKPILEANLATDVNLMTDSSSVYRNLKIRYNSHEVVNHSAGEYVRGTAHTNTIEGFFSVFKRGMFGTYQHCGSQHLQRYLSEFDFRYNHRAALEIDDKTRVTHALQGIAGKRLTYRSPD